MLAQQNKQFFLKWVDQLFQSGILNKTFHQFEWKGQKIPSIFELLQKFQCNLCLSDQILICGMCLMMRVVKKSLKTQENSIYKLAVACIFIAQKFYCDFQYNAQDFSVQTGITIKSIALLEMKTLDLLDFDLIISQEDYDSVVSFWK